MTATERFVTERCWWQLVWRRMVSCPASVGKAAGAMANRQRAVGRVRARSSIGLGKAALVTAGVWQQ